jgi:hypothetical protein
MRARVREREGERVTVYEREDRREKLCVRMILRYL